MHRRIGAGLRRRGAACRAPSRQHRSTEARFFTDLAVFYSRGRFLTSRPVALTKPQAPGKMNLPRSVAGFLRACSTHRKRDRKSTSELQSPDHLLCRLLLEKKKNHHHNTSSRDSSL